jgi:tRNA pseudouridine55 synthase
MDGLTIDQPEPRFAVRSAARRRPFSRAGQASRTAAIIADGALIAVDGLLLIDKPAGPTSHDVVARMRRVLGEHRIGHTGTLDPAATGVLALVLGRATRLAQFLIDSDKSYEAVVRFGFSTDTADAQGRTTGPVTTGGPPSREAIEAALDGFRGAFLQQPPAFSAKKIDGIRSHKLARARSRARAALSHAAPSPLALSHAAPSHLATSDTASALPGPPDPPALPAPVTVTAYAINIVSLDGDKVTLSVECSAGFYVRSLAHDLGERLGVGAHLAGLRRTRAGDFTLERAIELETAERDPWRAAAAMVPINDMLPRFARVSLTSAGVRRAINGCQLGPADMQQGRGMRDSGLNDPAQTPSPNPQSLVRLLDPGGELVGIARPSSTPGLLHPSIVLV